MIEASQLTKSYGDHHAVTDVTFKIARGEVVGFLGPNGAGKTTTLRMLTTFLVPSSGTAHVAGFDIRRQAAEVRRSIGYLPETPPLYLEMRVRDYLAFVAKIKGVDRQRVRSSVDDVIDRCNLQSVATRICQQLSKGYRQRVGLAQAIVHRPQVIFLDEPTSGLDPTQIIEMRSFIRDLQADHTVLLSTHILSEVSETCTDVLIIGGGRIVAHRKLQELTREHTLEQRFLEAIAAEELANVDGPVLTAVAV